MKNAIVTVAIGDRHRQIFQETRPSMEAYAKRIGADLIVIGDEDKSSSSPEYERFRVFWHLNKYKRVILLDCDVAIRRDCPSLFDVVPEGELGAFNEGEFADFTKDMSAIAKATETEIPKWDRQYYNTGVMVLSRCHKFLFEPPEAELQGLSEQLVNMRIITRKVKVKQLEYKFNRLQCVDPLTGEPRHASYIIHYAGMRGKVSTETQIGLINRDTATWGDNPTLDFKRNILVKTHGGLGDEICAEPVIRYMAEKAYPDANITVATWFPRLFRHLPVKVVGINEFKPEFDTPYYLMETLVPPENPAWRFMSANLMHATDFMSQMCLRAILPDESKKIKLDITLEDIKEVSSVLGSRSLRDLVLVHPGKGWDSKSFPKEYWERVIAGISAAGLQVVLVGKDISDEQGTIQIDVPQGVIDARNLLSLGGLIALVGKARVLISNDSSPVHIAAAFENEIILIPTCKHPDHVLAPRAGGRMWRAQALYKRLLFDAIDSTPTQIHGKTIDKVVGDIMDYLPEVDEVIEAAKKAYGRTE